jgi:hypothetical protein
MISSIRKRSFSTAAIVIVDLEFFPHFFGGLISLKRKRCCSSETLGTWGVGMALRALLTRRLLYSV